MTPAGSNTAENYGFDASTNLTSSPAATTTTYDYAGELTSSTLSSNTTSYTYNADGERLTAKQGTTTLATGAWNGAGQLTAYTNPNRDEYLKSGQAAIENNGGINGGANDAEDSPTASAYNIASAVVDSVDKFEAPSIVDGP